MILVVLALAGCRGGEGAILPEQQGVWLQGFYFRWDLFNHRMSYLHARVDGEDAEVAVVGGTSTTLETIEPLPDACDPESCREFPFIDEAEVRLGWGRVTSSTLGLGAGQAELMVGRDGAQQVVFVPIDAAAEGSPTAVLSGLVFDTDAPLAGSPACYQPRYGWHPRRIHVAISDVTRVAEGVDVAVEATFVAGPSEDPDRVCIDEVHDRAVVRAKVDVLVVVGTAAVTDAAVTAAAVYPFSGDAANPEPQAEVAPAPLPWPADEGISGWAAIDFSFNPEVERGIYLRSWGFEQTSDGASGVTTNFSQFTQLWDASYRFDGVARQVEVDGQIERGVLSETFPVEVDEVSRAPDVHTRSLPDSDGAG